MFNLENAIKTWRQQLANDSLLSGEILDELEGHLRDEVDEQLRSGKTPEDAFNSAVIQMGHIRELGTEFSKLDASGAQKPRYLTVFCFLSAALIATNAVALYPEFAEKASISHLLAFIGILGMFAYLAALPFCYRRLPDVRRPVVAWALNLGSLLVSFWVLLALLSVLELVQVKLDEGIVQLCWAALPAFFATLLAYKTFAFGRNRAQPPIVKAISPDADQALKLARDEAIHLGHDFIGTEHLLLGLLRIENRITARVLNRFELDEHLIRADIEKIVSRGCAQSDSRTIPYTPRAKSVIDFAGREAAAMDRNAVGPEHLFLGILLEPTGVAGVILRNLRVNLDQARAEILKAIHPDDDAGPAPVVAT